MKKDNKARSALTVEQNCQRYYVYEQMNLCIINVEVDRHGQYHFATCWFFCATDSKTKSCHCASYISYTSSTACVNEWTNNAVVTTTTSIQFDMIFRQAISKAWLRLMTSSNTLDTRTSLTPPTFQPVPVATPGHWCEVLLGKSVHQKLIMFCVRFLNAVVCIMRWLTYNYDLSLIRRPFDCESTTVCRPTA